MHLVISKKLSSENLVILWLSLETTLLALSLEKGGHWGWLEIVGGAW